MTTVKTAISLPKPLFYQLERIAAAQGVPRSQLYAEALVQYVDRADNERLLRELNAAYDADGQSEEIDTVEQYRRWRRTALGGRGPA